MKVNIEMENLENKIESIMKENIDTVIKQEVDDYIKTAVEYQCKTIITDVINQNLVNFVTDYIKTATVKVGGGFYSKEPEETFTVEEFIKKEIADKLQSKELRVPSKDRYSNDGYQKVSFEEFIKNQFDVEAVVKKSLEGFISETRNEINNKINTTFTDVTKSMLSETVYSVLMANDTFKKINDNVKCIADGK